MIGCYDYGNGWISDTGIAPSTLQSFLSTATLCAGTIRSKTGTIYF
jgi:hypothetical protein